MEPVYLHTPDLSGGMANRPEPWLIGQNQANHLANVDVTRPGTRRRRYGTSSVGGHTGLSGGLFRHKDETLLQDVLLAINGSKLYRLTGQGLMQQVACGVSTTQAIHAGIEGYWGVRVATYVCHSFQDPSTPTTATRLIAFDDQNAFSQSASMAPLCATWFQRRLWCAGNTVAENDETLWWSALNDGLSYSLTNTVQVEPGVGGRITGLLEVRSAKPTLMVFKERAICAFEPVWGTSGLIPGAGDALDTVNSNLRTLSKNVGCVATGSIQSTPGAPFGDIIFLAEDGFRSIRRAEQDVIAGVSPPISEVIQATIDRINWSWVGLATSTIHNRYYYCTLPLDGATRPTHVISLDLQNGSWYLHDWAAIALTSSKLLQSQPELWMQYADSTTDCGVTGAFTGYHTYLCFDGFLDPGGVAVPMQETTRAFLPAQDITLKSKWEWAALSVKNEAGATFSLMLEYNLDQEGWVTFATLSFAATALNVYLGETPLPWEPNTTKIQTRQLSLADLGPGYAIQFRYTTLDTYAIPSILDFALLATPIGPDYDNTV